jgi:hypothetical protein
MDSCQCSLKYGIVQASDTFAGAIPAGEMDWVRKFRKVSQCPDRGKMRQVRGNSGQVAIPSVSFPTAAALWAMQNARAPHAG